MRVAYIVSLFGGSMVYGAIVGQTIKTSSGPVSGHTATFNNDVVAYLGIPYALPPVGSLRFMPPVKYKGDTIINGSSIGFACSAVTSFAGRGNDLNNYNLTLANLTAQGVATISTTSQLTDTFSEDCLTLNVWVPATGGGESKAVMIFIYGGGYKSGSTQISMYDGQNLAAEQDVIVVTLNYRLGILGFPGAPASTHHNPAFLDQRMAVEWVNENIAAFGGDTSRMVLWGQSAGSASVDHHAYAWASEPLVSGFIMESGAAAWGKPLALNNAQAWYGVSARLGCGTKDITKSSDILRCLQQKHVSELLNAVGDYSFTPTVDDKTGFSDYPALSRAGKFAQLPILIGNNDWEAGMYIPNYALLNMTKDDSYWANKSNTTFACPAGARANISSSHGLPVWRYRWFGEFPNTRLSNGPESGAYHCSEIGIIWDTLPTGAGIPPDTPEEISIRAYVQGAWAAFAKNPWGGLETYEDGWPLYSPYEPTLIRLAYDNITGTNAVLAKVYDGTCLTIYPLDDPHQRSEL